MKSDKNLILLGMMGSGKSTIGRLLSKSLNLEFYDVDQIIEKEANLKISEIFKKKGEFFFRQVEKKKILQLLKYKNKVISLGGGAFLNNIIRQDILSNHISYWLKWNNLTLINRINNSKKRPIAYNSNDAEIKKIILERSKIYSMANFKINCEKLSKNEIVKKIKNIYEKN